jgi:hypothetical protein
MNDKGRIAKGFQALRADGYLASGRAGFTRQEGYHRLLKLDPNARTYLFYTDQGEADSFDSNGNLRKTLYLYWAGEAQTISQAFRDHGLSCDVPDANSAVALLPNPEAIPDTFESVSEAMARRYGRVTGRPAARETIHETLVDEAALFRSWLSQEAPELFELFEVDRLVCPLDNIYERYVGFGLPDLRGN